MTFPFTKIYVLNQKSRPDRLKQFMEFGIEDCQVIHSVEGEYPAHSFCRSQHHILKLFVESGADNCLVFEDDALLRPMDHLMAAVKELPENWATLHLGANVTDGVSCMMENQPEYYSTHLARLKCAWASQAVAYSRYMAEAIVMSYDPDSKEMYDDWLSRHVLRTNPCFIVRPTIVWQRPVQSDLWGTYADYTGAWENTDQKLMAL